MKKKQKKMITTGSVIFMIVLLLCFAYTGIYLNARKNAKKADVRYYEAGDKVLYGGVEYVVSAKLYTEEELLEEFGLEDVKYKMASVSDSMEFQYVVVEKNMKRVSALTGNEREEYLFTVAGKYWSFGVDDDVQSLIQKEDYIPAAELEVGEETSGYQVYNIAKSNYCKSKWEELESATLYFEMLDYEGSEYLRRIRIIN